MEVEAEELEREEDSAVDVPVVKSAAAHCQFQVPSTLNGPEAEQAATVSALRHSIKEKEETLRKLKLVQLYKKKWEKNDLSELGDRWKAVAQAALMELYEKQQLVHEDLTMEKLLEHFKIDPEFIGYDVQEEAFR